ncbi:MAG: hypothetical protein LQ338_002952 [Usnochroma carphineum]|nr:MAG: hypothetical protein LQ338_002952 [Usnochroma carphineum]
MASPPNIRFRLYDVREEPHEDMLEKYDIVHVRHLNLVIKNNDPTTVLDHLLKMLKPGGYLQWGEFDPGKIQEVKANPDCSVAEMRGLQKRIRDFFPGHAASQKIQRGSLHNVCYEARWTHESRLRTVMDVGLLVVEEMVDRIASEKKATVEEIEELRGRLAKAADESRKGAAWDLESIVAVGQKPARPNTE